MSLLRKLKQSVALILGISLTVVMFPVILAATSFLLMAGFALALIAANRMSQRVKEAERSGGFGNTHSSAVKRAALEGSYYVVQPSS